MQVELSKAFLLYVAGLPLGQHRTQRKIPSRAMISLHLTAEIIALAIWYGRYGYRRITKMLCAANADGTLEGLAPQAALTPAKFRERRVGLLAQLLGLLLAFIGPGLTSRLVGLYRLRTLTPIGTQPGPKPTADFRHSVRDIERVGIGAEP